MYKLDLAGQRFGNLFVVSRIENGTKGRTLFLCRCDCGTEKIVSGQNLMRGHAKSCGCLKHKPQRQNLIGQRFGRLTVIDFAGTRIDSNGKHITYYKVHCDCGNELEVMRSSLKTGKTQSCGCLWEETITTHGLSKKRLYSVWHGMRQRCYNTKTRGYKNYGGRGIKICDEWLGEHGFENFYEWAMANGYDENAKRGDCTIDRINNDGNYEPSNCRWVDLEVQRTNQRKRGTTKNA